MANAGWDGGLSGALLPVLLHKLSNATQLLSNLNALLGLPGGEALALSRSTDLARTSTQVDDLGWLLASLASAAGANLVLERREKRALVIALPVLEEALRRQGHSLRYSSTSVPYISLHVLGGWELAWAVCALGYAAAKISRGPLELAFSRADPQYCFCFNQAGLALAPELLAGILQRLPGARWSAGEQSSLLCVPGAWVESAGA